MTRQLFQAFCNSGALRAFTLALCLLLGLSFLPGEAGAVTPEEQKRIDRLLSALEQRTDLVFIRNGSEHTAKEAVAHLRLKLGKAGKRINTAEQFIDYLASASSISKKPYMIKSPGKGLEPAGPFLHKMLRGLP